MILELSGKFPVNMLCEEMRINRSSFYYWKERLAKPAPRTKNLVSSIAMFQEYHLRFTSHGYRWLNAKIRLDTGRIMSAPFAHKCCKIAGIKSQAKHYKYKKPGDPFRIFPNLLSAEMVINGPLECIVSDMTAFRVHGVYYELTLYMDLWNNEIVAHDYAAAMVHADRWWWCIHSAEMVHGDRVDGARSPNLANYSVMPLRFRMESPTIRIV